MMQREIQDGGRKGNAVRRQAVSREAVSREAWEQSRGRHAQSRELILKLLRRHAGLSSIEIAERTGWALHTFSGRLSELKAAGLIRGTGQRRRGAEVLEIVRGPEQMWLMEVA